MNNDWFEAQYNEIENTGVDGWFIGVKASQRARLNQILIILNELSGSYESVLDIGCGIGIFGSLLKNTVSIKNYVGCDISQKAIDYVSSRESGSSKYFHCALPDLPEQDAKYNLILLLEVLYYLNSDDQKAAMKNIIGAAEPNAYICITGSNANENYFSDKFFENLHTSGLKLILETYHHSKFYYYLEDFLMLPVRLDNLLLSSRGSQNGTDDIHRRRIKQLFTNRFLSFFLKPPTKLISIISLAIIRSEIVFKLVCTPSKIIAPKASTSGIIRVYQKM